MSVVIRRGSDRFVDQADGRVTRHGFSFGPHYDPDRLSFGSMVCHDDHLLGPGRGFETHQHSGLEIVSYVLSGALVHTDSTGVSRRVTAGSVAHLSTGDGVEHSEIAADDAGPTRFVQVWLRADPAAPVGSTYSVVEPTLVAGRLTPVLEVDDARFSVAHLSAGGSINLPGAVPTHAFVATGALLRSSLAQPLSAGDAFWLTEHPATTITAAVDSTVLVWQLG